MYAPLLADAPLSSKDQSGLACRDRTDSVASVSFRHKRPKRVSHYILGPIMGEGIYGTVRDAIYMNGPSCTRVSIKCIQKNLRSKADAKRIEALLINEVEFLQRFFHDNVIRAQDIFCSADGRDFLVMPVAVCSLQQLLDVRAADLMDSGRDTVSPSAPHLSSKSNAASEFEPSNVFLFTKNRLLPTPLVKDIMFQTVSGVAYLHKQNVHHNDINPGNILLFADGTVKLTDLGCCGQKFLGQGTPAFVSPQVAGAGPDGEVDAAKNDVWACGILLYFLITNEWPFPFTALENEFEVYRIIRESEVNMTVIEECEPGAVSLLQGMLNKDERQRFTAAQVLDHEWVQKETITKSFIQQTVLEKKSSGLSPNKDSVSSRQHNVRRIFNVKEIDRMMVMDRMRHESFAHELRFILGIPAGSKASRAAMDSMVHSFIPQDDFLYYRRKGRPEADVRSIIVDSVKLRAVEAYCANILDNVPFPKSESGEYSEESPCCRRCTVS